MSEEDHFRRFKEATEKQISELEAFKDGLNFNVDLFRALEQKLVELPKKLEYKILAPVSKVAFFDAKLVRTNEVMVTISRDNIAECSTFTANNIIRRRIDATKQNIVECDKSIKVQRDRLELGAKICRGENISLGKEIEIKEEYDEKKEEEFKRKREQRREEALMKLKNVEKLQETIKKDVIVPELKIKEKKEEKVAEKNPEVVEARSSCDDHESVLKLLDALERQEKKNRELESEDDDEGSVVVRESGEEEDEGSGTDDENELATKYHEKMRSLPGVGKKEYDSLMEYLKTHNSSSDESDGDSENEKLDSDDELVENTSRLNIIEEVEEPEPEAVPIRRRSSVRFAETLEQTKIIEELPDKFERVAVEENPTSILKSTLPTPVDREAIERADRETNGTKKVVSSSKSAFPGMVVERDPMSSAMSARIEEAEAKKQPATQAKISKFKAARMRRN